jgi:hypothetical protein
MFSRGQTCRGRSQSADSDEVARAFRDDVARDYEMMSPGFGASLACVFFVLGRCRSSVIDCVQSQLGRVPYYNRPPSAGQERQRRCDVALARLVDHDIVEDEFRRDEPGDGEVAQRPDRIMPQDRRHLGTRESSLARVTPHLQEVLPFIVVHPVKRLCECRHKASHGASDLPRQGFETIAELRLSLFRGEAGGALSNIPQQVFRPP